MPKTTKPTGSKTIIDVAHPGKSAPSGNSKSVIISNRPILKDPMMVDDTVSISEDDSLAKVSNKSTARPLTAPLLKTEEADAVPAAETPQPPAEPAEPAPQEPSSKDEPVSGDAPATDKPAKPDKTPEPSEPSDEPDKATVPDDKPEETKPPADQPKSAAKPTASDKPAPADSKPAEPADANTEEATAPKDVTKTIEAEATKEAERQAAIDKLAESKKYYLPINTVEKRRSRRFVILGILLSLLLVIAWADIALDASLIHIDGIKPLTHFFSN